MISLCSERLILFRPSFIDGVVLHKGQPTTVYFVLVGAGVFVNHFQGLKRAPNVKLVYDVTKGFNKGALSFVVCTRNKQGIGATELVMNYGLEFDITRKHPKTESYIARFKGPLLKFMRTNEMEAIAVGDVDQNSQGSEGGGAPALAGGGVPEGSDDGGGESGGGVPRPAEGEAEGSEEAKKARTGGLRNYTEPWHFNVHYTSKDVTLENCESANKRLPKGFEFASWTQGVFEKVTLEDGKYPKTHFPYAPKGDCLAFDLNSKTLKPLKQMMSEYKAEYVWGCKGTEKSLVSTESKYGVKLDPDSLSFLTGAELGSGLVATFGYKYDASKRTLNPSSAGVYLSKMATFPAMDAVVM